MQTTANNQVNRSITQQVDEIIQMIGHEEDHESTEEQQELPVEQAQEAYQDRHHQRNQDLSWDEDFGFALEVSIVQEDEFQTTYHFKRKAAELEIEHRERLQRTRRVPERLSY